jgi:hypothetical protein
MTEEERKERHEWLLNDSWFKARPEHVRKFIEKWPPYEFYRIKNSGEAFGVLVSYDEEVGGDISVKIDMAYNTLFPRRVFGVKPEYLEIVNVDDSCRDALND